jgi:hypothetical protein
MLGSGIWQYNQPNTIQFVLADSSANPVTGLGSGLTIQLAKSSGGFAASAGTIEEIGLGWYRYISTAGEADTLGPISLNISAPGTVGQDVEYVVGTRVRSAVETTYTVTSTVDSSPIAGVHVSISTNSAGTEIVWTGITDAFGVARDSEGNKPFLDPGTYYFFLYRAGYAFENPDTEIVEAE